MNRRDFVAASCAAAAAPLTTTVALGRQDDPRQYYEMRRYHTLVGEGRQRLNDFLRDAAIPAWNRLGIQPVGVFNVQYGPSSPTLYVLLPHPSLEAFATAAGRLTDDAAYQEAGAAFLNTPLSDPGYVRIESSLLRAFPEMPKLEAPAEPAPDSDRRAEQKPRIFELRIYESHSEAAARKKLEMFNKGGEIPIFRRTGLTPVFFGETLIGPQMPNLTYMLTFDDLAARDRGWDAFRADPEWDKLSKDSYYADTVSNITDLILQPAPFSQI